MNLIINLIEICTNFDHNISKTKIQKKTLLIVSLGECLVMAVELIFFFAGILNLFFAIKSISCLKIG